MLNFDIYMFILYIYILQYNKSLIIKKKIKFMMKNDMLKFKYEIFRLNIFKIIYIYIMSFLKIFKLYLVSFFIK